MPAPVPTAPDPHGIGAAAHRLSGGARRTGKAALAVLAVVLEPGVVVEQLLVGTYHGVDGAVALAGDEVVLVNTREWEPEVTRLPLAGLAVQGLQDGRHASLTFTGPGGQDAIERIGDTDLAVELANRIRARAGG